MPNVKFLKEPGFLYDLNYLFYLNFNTQECIDSLATDEKKEANVKYLKEILQHFGDISEDLYVFYHAVGNDHCFISTHYLDPYKDQFANGFDFKEFKKLLSDTDQLMKNIIRYYLSDLSEDELAECMDSNTKLFARIKESQYSSEEKSHLYEFFINPAPYLQTLQYELIEKEPLLSAYYKENVDKIIEVQNRTTFDELCENVKDISNLDVLRDDEQILYTSFCLLDKYHLQLFFVSDGAVYLLGYDYTSIISEVVNSKRTHSLDALCSALSESNRIKILKLLLEREEVICKDLERIFNFSGSTAYHHITILTRIGAVKVRNEGKNILYSLNRKYFDHLIGQLSEFSNKRNGLRS